MTQNTFLLVTTAKDEGPNLLEWVAHHRLCGFDHIQIYQNDSGDGTTQALRILDRLGFITLMGNKHDGGNHVRRAHRRASQHDAFAASTWCMTLDMNEYLSVSQGEGRVQDLVAACPEDADAILVNQRIFGSNGHKNLRPELATERFTACEATDGRRVAPFRALFRTAAFGRPAPHMPIEPKIDDPTIYNASGLRDFERTETDAADPGEGRYGQINRYALRDLTSFLVRQEWNSTSATPDAVGHDGWMSNDLNDDSDETLANRADALLAEMEIMNTASDGRLMRLRRRAIRSWKERGAEILEREDIAALRSEILQGNRSGFAATPFRLPGTHRRTPVFSSSRAQFDEVAPEPKRRPLLLRGT